MADVSWLSAQAHQIHDTFNSLFYLMVTVFLCLGVFVEYFKWPLGGTPSFSILVGRALIAIFLLSTYSEVTNLLADVSDGLASKLGDLNQIKLVVSSMGDHLKTLSFSWVSVRDTVTMVISFAAFFLLYFSTFVLEAFLLYTWTMLYVFSPVLIALYVLPATAPATSGLYRSLIEVSCWKIVWSVLATLMWSTALSDINKPGHEIGFITSICFNLVLAGSLLLTPMVVHALAGAGLASMAQSIGGVAVGGMAFTPLKALSAMQSGMQKAKAPMSKLKEVASERYQDWSNKRAYSRLKSREPRVEVLPPEESAGQEAADFGNTGFSRANGQAQLHAPESSINGNTNRKLLSGTKSKSPTDSKKTEENSGEVKL